jgi:hypothetical protein
MWMIPYGWKVERSRSSMMLTCPESAARIVVHEALTPIADLASMIAAAKLPDFAFDRSRLERMVTSEGDRAFLVGGVAGCVAMELGFVLLDDTYVRFVGTGSNMEQVATTVRELVLSTRVFVASQRRRRFWYRTPPGWRKAASEHEDTWLAPSFPTHRSCITVLRAVPVLMRSQHQAVADLLGARDGIGEAPVMRPLVTRAGLMGSRWVRPVRSDDGVALDIIVVALSDRSYDYFVRAIVPRGQTHELVELLESIEPLPNVALVSVLAASHAYLAS